MPGPVSVDELQRAWQAVERGDFGIGSKPRGTRPSGVWTPDGPTHLVVGVTGRAGATTTALALAEAHPGLARVVECAPAHRTGLAAAASAELGLAGPWRRGTRADVLLERSAAATTDLDKIAPPQDSDGRYTVVDVGWDLTTVLASSSWLAAAVRALPTIVATVATAPGIRRLGTTLATFRAAGVVVLGPAIKRWPEPARIELTRQLADLDERGRLVCLPYDRDLDARGLTAAPLPARLLNALAPFSSEGTHHRVDH